ncbi:carboxymuconolactone decarboxylase family protein [Rhodococcus koreensis]|uniref:carboxymuconolactone decarboxylase family protein n=1 Tax=Rhodococcus koreensis TaxID=99653 RepID=UPI00197F9634|nr:carboxymuconolactone decarboxylase family protein [Rhodococcus koreensis]QSE86099.1 carboxymuconolactone decarboxylase family protein [Rhodococcus koreensis]
MTDERGCLVGPFGVMLHEPAVGRRLQELGSALRFEVEISERLREIAILAVASVTACEFERYAHERIGLAAGLSPVELEQLAAGTFEGADAQEAAVHRFCRSLAEKVPSLDESAYQELRDVLGEALIVDLVVLAGYYVTLAHLLAVFDVPTPSH